MENQNNKVVFIHGRPSPHPLHIKYGESIGAKFVFVDFILRWHDKDSSRFKRYLSWLICALFLPDRKKYDVIFSEGAHFIVGLQKWLRLLKSNQKTIALLNNETLYFIQSGFYSRKTKKALIGLIQTYDGIISAGKMEADLARKYASSKAVVKQIFNGINDDRLKNLLTLNPKLTSHNIVFIGNVGSGWRSWYKGIDLLFESFELAWLKNNLLKLQLIGEWDKVYFNELVNKHAPKSKLSIECIGYTQKLDDYLINTSLYLHPARGEAWGISVTEAMAAGIMPLVSKYTGSQEVVAKVDPSYIIELDKFLIAKKIIEHFELSSEIKKFQSSKCKIVSEGYSESKSLDSFNKAFQEILIEVNLIK